MKDKGGVDIALIHYPVINKNQEVIGSAVTNLDIHDIARAACTFGIDDYFIVTPYEDQQQLVEEITDHWKTGYGANRNPARRKALEIVRVTSSLQEVIKTITEEKKAPIIAATSARQFEKTVSYRRCREMIESEKHRILLLFGTAHGMADEIMEQTDICLPPIKGAGKYNHLSVRSAVSIILDRLSADREEVG